ncbi:MAG: NAD-dependent epimerase/dehydratase family protein [Steroidobacter sp.]
MAHRIFITGASGFVGGAIAAALARTHEVHAMSRSPASDASIKAVNATPVRCELGATPADVLSGCDAVIHCAAFVKQWGARKQFWATNVDGTSQLLNAARSAGVRRFIHMGTEAALFRGQDMSGVDEDYPYPRHTPFLYSETKAAAERAVLAANAPGFATISIRPRFVWGPGDQTILPALESMVRAGRFVWIDAGRAHSSTTHIDNLVHGVTLALERGSGGNAYFVTDEGTTTLREFITALLATRGLTPPDKSIPGWLARSLGAMTESVWRLTGRKSEPPLTRFAAAMMSRDCTIKTEKARRELGFAPIVSRTEALAALHQR